MSGDTGKGGLTIIGIVVLTAPAPAQGFPVSIRSNSAAATVPSSVTVKAGSTLAHVPVLTHEVDADTTIALTATASGQSRTTSFVIPPGNFIAYAGSENEPVIGTDGRRLTGSNVVFSATVSAALDVIDVQASMRTSASNLHVILAAPPGGELRTGTYSGVTMYPTRGSQGALTFGSGALCFSPFATGPFSASFTIYDVTYDPGPTLRSLYASFSQSCTAGTALTGEMLITP
jgi:hypothetical protein